MPEQPTAPERLRWILADQHTQAWTNAAHWLHANSHTEEAGRRSNEPCDDCWRSAAFATKGVALAGYQHRDQVLTEAASWQREAAENLPDGHALIPGMLHAAHLLLTARTTIAVHMAGQLCGNPDCGPCSFDRAIPPAEMAAQKAARTTTAPQSAPDPDEWVRCSGLHCPNGERYAKAEERGWQHGHMDTWRCPACAARAGAPDAQSTPH